MANPMTIQTDGGEAGALTSMPGHLLRRCHQIGVALFLDECAAYDLTPLQYAVLNLLESRGPQDQATLGGCAALDRTTVAVVVRNLEERGLVSRRQSSQDRRSKIVSISDEGEALFRSCQDKALNSQQRLVAPLEPEERDEFKRLLAKLAEGNNAYSRAPQKGD